jgi:anhydro-N-acetylmuramic acid kinase
MNNRPMLVLGMMSGTSADGIDVALARISGAPPHLKIKLLGHTGVPFPSDVRAEILHVAEQKPITAGRLSHLNFRLGALYGDAALKACRKFRVASRRIELLGNHGQTVFHQSWGAHLLGAACASTLQIGDASVIAACSGITTVSDFRPADVALGGQGAPLVPYVDYLLYRHSRLGRISLNLGGIANITVLPAAAKPSSVLGFDTGPANILIDSLVAHFTNGRKRFDKDALLALKGHTSPDFLRELMRDPYLRLSPPKSTGREYYGQPYIRHVLALGRRFRAEPNDIIRAATLFTALSIAEAINRVVLPKTKIHQLVVSGGGAYNPLILAQLAALLPSIEIVPSSDFGIPVEAKEALAFALLAYETFHHRPSNLPSATGASKPAILGKISYAPPR